MGSYAAVNVTTGSLTTCTQNSQAPSTIGPAFQHPPQNNSVWEIVFEANHGPLFAIFNVFILMGYLHLNLTVQGYSVLTCYVKSLVTL